MQFSTSFVVFIAIVTSAFHMVIVSAIPYGFPSAYKSHDNLVDEITGLALPGHTLHTNRQANPSKEGMVPYHNPVNGIISLEAANNIYRIFSKAMEYIIDTMWRRANLLVKKNIPLDRIAEKVQNDMPSLAMYVVFAGFWSAHGRLA
ncbi:hypothetical protein BC835DRAFT_1331536 [Cytidiella melzeri]|nr:hypothetical protein BC835DRAFT_1331536 [Cytidiella melzeri]